MLLYMVKHSCPNLANMTGKLSKANDDMNPAAYKELLCEIKYVLDTKNVGLMIEPMENSNKPWEIVCFSNSDYMRDPISRRSINGFILYALGDLVCWQLKLQKSVSLYSSEAKDVALSDICD